MAKASLDDFTNSSVSPADWMAQRRAERAARLNAENARSSEAQGVVMDNVEQLKSQGVEFSEDQIANAIKQAQNSPDGSFDLGVPVNAKPVLPQQAAAKSAPAATPVQQTTPEEEPGILANITKNLFGETLGTNLSDAAEVVTQASKGLASRFQQAMARSNEISARLGGGIAGAPSYAYPTTLPRSEEERQARIAGFGEEQRAAGQRAGAAEQRAAQVQQTYEDGSLGYHVMGALQSAPTMAAGTAATLAGGPALGALVVGGSTASQQYGQQIDEGTSEGKALASAVTQGTLEGGMDAITFGIAKYGLGPVRDFAVKKLGANAASELIGRVLNTTAGKAAVVAAEGAVNEPITTAAQMASDAVILDKTYSDDEWNTAMRDSLVQGMAMSAGVYGAAAPARIMAERAERTGRATEGGIAAGLAARQNANQARTAAPIIQEQPDLFGTPEGLPTQEQYQADRQRELESDAAYNVRNRQQREQQPVAVREQRRGEVRQSIQNRVDTARQRVESLQEDIEGGATDSATLNTAAAANRDLQTAETDLANFDQSVAPTPSQTETEQATSNDVSETQAPTQDDLFAQQEQDSLATQKEESAKQTEADKKEFESAQKRVESNRRARIAALRRTVANEVMSANPNITQEQFTAEVNRITAERDAANQAKANAKKPKAAAAPAAAPSVSIPTPSQPAKADTEVTDEDLRQQLRAAGMDIPDANPSLSQDGSANVSDQPDSDEEYVRKATQTVRNIGKRFGKGSRDVQELIAQGKLVLASNPDSVGRKPTNSVAQYDTGEGKMYLYMDRIDPDNAVGAIAASLHEATHAGQFNDRQGRPSIYVQMMSKSGNNKASNAIRVAASKGNVMAQRAVERARDASPDTKVRDLELVPYFVTEAVNSRRSTYGQLGGVVRDIRAAGKNFLRGIGLDMDVSLNDIDSAAQGVGGEIVQTDLAPTDADVDTMNMIAGPSATDFEAAQRAGRTYRGRVDNGERFEIPDNQAELMPDAAEKLKSGNATLGDVLKHDRLFDNYPDLREIPVVQNPQMMSNMSGQWYNGRIDINPSLLAPDKKEELRNLLLHETQHAVQQGEGFTAGANSAMFRSTKPMQDRIDAERRLDKASESLELATAINSLNPRGRQAWDTLVKDQDLSMLSVGDRARWFLGQNLTQFSNNANIRRVGENFNKAREDLIAATTAMREDGSKAFQRYLRDYGEAEARNTEARSRMTQAQLDAAAPESTFDVPVSETTDNRRMMGQEARAFSETLDQQPTGPVPEEKLSDKEHLTRILSKGTQNHTADIKIAEDYDTRYRRALRNDVGVKYDKPEVHKDILAMLGKVDDAAPADRPAMMAAFQKKYPTLAPLLADARAEIDRQTNDYIQKLMSTGRPLSNTEVKNVQTMLANRGKYLTRAYSAFQSGVGRKWRENVWSDYKNNLNKYTQDATRLPPHVRENVERVMGAMDVLKKKLVIPDDDALLGLNMDKLSEMYADHIGPLNRIRTDDTEAKRAVMVQALADRRESIPEKEMNALAENAVKETLNLTGKNATSGMATRLSKLARDPGTLKEKEFVPEEIRKLFGEIKDPGGIMLSTMSAQASLNSRMGLYKDLMTQGEGRHVLAPGRINEEGMRARFPNRLDGEQYGPLEGYYATDRAYSALTDQVRAFNTYGEALKQFSNDWTILGGKVARDVGRTLGRATRLEKLLGVVYTPFNFAGNALGSPVTLLRQGNFLGKGTRRGINTAKDYVAGSMWNTTTDLLNDSIRYVNIESVDVAEMQRVLGDKMGQYLDGADARQEAMSKLRQSLQTAGNVVRKGNKLAVAGYSVMDNWAKIANFYDRADTLQKYYEAAGEKRTKDQILREAGDVTSYTNLSPERVHSFLRGLESNGVTKFLPYFSEVFRTTLTNYTQGLTDLRRASETENPKAAAIMRNAGLRRIIGNTLATFGLPALFTIPAMGAMLASGGGEDEKKKRHMIGEFSRDQDLFQFGTDKNGMPVYMAVSTRLDPHGPVTDLVRLAVNAEDDKALYNGVKNYVGENLLLIPSWGKNLIGALTKPTVPESTTAQVFPDLSEAMQNSGIDPNNTNKMLRVVDAWLPGIIKAQAPYARPAVDSVETGVSREGLEAMNWMGARFETLNPQRTLNDYNFASNEAQKAARAVFNDNILNAAKLKDEDVVRWATELRAKEFDRLVEDQKNVASLRAWGFDEDTIAELLKTAKWSKADIDTLLSGEGTAQLSIKTLDNAVQRRIQGTTDQALRDQYEKRGEEARNIIMAHADEFANMGLEVKED